MSVFLPASPQAAAISGLFLQVLGVCAVILVIVTAIVALPLMRYRHKPGQAEPKPHFGNRALETAWTVVPFLVVVWLLVLTAKGMRGSEPPLDQSPDLHITSHQWWWEALYPQSGVVTANEIHIPIGRRLLVALDSADVIHDFWVPQLAPKMDSVPGHPNRLWLQADTPGSYVGTCAEYCGAQHAHMRFLVIAQQAKDYEAWLTQQQTPAAQSQDAQAREGYRLFQQMSCVACHTVQGSGAQGRTAPDLTHFGSRQSFGAVLLPNTPENLAGWLSHPQQLKPGTLMPDLKLTDSQAKALVAYLGSLQ
jgi:cytochrome c oxidase subunit 2